MRRSREEFDDFSRLLEILHNEIRVIRRSMDNLHDELQEIGDPSIREEVETVLVEMQGAKDKMDRLKYILLEHM